MLYWEDTPEYFWLDKHPRAYDIYRQK
jgi:hypothetical protein